MKPVEIFLQLCYTEVTNKKENYTMRQKTKGTCLFILGVAICFGLAGLSVLLEGLIPGGLLGASIIALFAGTIINSFFHPAWIKPALKFTSKRILKLAIILLGASSKAQASF